jgi:ubiquinone/menaquinone biosynthesis C-methylase UbiE
MNKSQSNNNPQAQVWDNEYRNKNFMSGTKPQKSVVKFAKSIKKARKVANKSADFTGLKVLDLGCGEGKNMQYFTERGAEVWGIDISPVGVAQARRSLAEAGLMSQVELVVGSIGEVLPYAADFFDIVLDVTSSNALDTPERMTYLQEVHRVLKPGGKLFVRTLCKDGDANAKTLLKEHPSHERDTYTLPVSGLTERVFTRDDLLMLYTQYFKLIDLEKEEHYTTMQDATGSPRKYKRHFWILRMEKTLSE